MEDKMITSYILRKNERNKQQMILQPIELFNNYLVLVDQIFLEMVMVEVMHQFLVQKKLDHITRMIMIMDMMKMKLFRRNISQMMIMRKQMVINFLNMKVWEFTIFYYTTIITIEKLLRKIEMEILYLTILYHQIQII